jgi:hypothetical protein
MDPDPAIFVIDLQAKIKNKFFLKSFPASFFKGIFYIILQR